MTFTGRTCWSKMSRRQIATYTKQRKQLVDESTGLLAVSVAEPKSLAANPTASGEKKTWFLRWPELPRLKPEKQRLTDELNEVRKEVAALDEAEASIVELQRKHGLLEQHYNALSAGQNKPHGTKNSAAAKRQILA